MSLINKLIRVERSVQAYRNSDNELVDDFILDISLNELLKIVSPKEDDPDLIDGYILDKNQIEKLNEFAERKIESDFKLYWYVLVCLGVYNW